MSEGLPALVPFGKYRGQPVTVLAADRGYLEWASLQPSLVQRFRWLVGLAGGAAVPVLEELPTPEHNRLQARFLDPEVCISAAILLTGSYPEYYRIPDLKIHGPLFTPVFEEQAIDVTIYSLHYHVTYKREVAHEKDEEYDADFDPDADKIVSRQKIGPHLYASIELKTIIGDDFPAVLRNFSKKLEKRSRYHLRAIIVEHFAADGLTFEQARAMAAASEIKLRLMSEIEAERDRLFPGV